MTDTLLLANPPAGGGRGLAYAVTAAQRLRDSGDDVRVVIGQSADHAAEIAHRAVAERLPRLVVCGGDGLIHLVLQRVPLSDTTLGIIPAGTGNDIARALGLPLRNPLAAAEVILSGGQRSIDLGRVGDRWFASVLAIGLDSRVNDRANQLRWPRGRARFHAALALELPSFNAVSMHVVLDGQVLELDAMLVAVGNGSCYGGGMRICPDADLSDGLFDVTIVTAMPHSKLMRLFPTVYSGRHVSRPEVLTFRAGSVEITADDISGYADGELVGHLPLTSHVVSSAVRVLA